MISNRPFGDNLLRSAGVRHGISQEAVLSAFEKWLCTQDFNELRAKSREP